MGCLTNASQYELALYAYEKSVLLMNPWYGEGPGNTRTWQEKNNWYHKKPPSLLKPWTWFTNECNDFLLKSLESRFNFVKAVSTHGTDIMITNKEFYAEVRLKPFSYENLNNLYDLFQYDFDYSKYVKACESGNGSGLSEPIIESYRK